MIEHIADLMFPHTERLAQEWTSPIYAFFHARPSIEIVNGRRCHEFICSASHCKGKGSRPRRVCRFLDTGDARSTSNLRKHAKQCWGADIIEKADEVRDQASVREGLAAAKTLNDGTITAAFERKGKGKVTYLARQHTYKETRYVATSLTNALAEFCVGLSVFDG
jgi:hypothetical protein